MRTNLYERLIKLTGLHLPLIRLNHDPHNLSSLIYRHDPTKVGMLFSAMHSVAYSVGKLGKKCANCAGKGLIAESGVDWRLKKHTKNSTIFAHCFFFNGGLTPKKQFFVNISLSMHSYGKSREWRIVSRKISNRILYSKLSLDLIISLQSCRK